VSSITKKLEEHLRDEGLGEPQATVSSKGVVRQILKHESVDLAEAPKHISEKLEKSAAQKGFDVYLSFAEEDKYQAELLRNSLASWGVSLIVSVKCVAFLCDPRCTHNFQTLFLSISLLKSTFS
jgi:hypothetical protein